MGELDSLNIELLGCVQMPVKGKLNRIPVETHPHHKQQLRISSFPHCHPPLPAESGNTACQLPAASLLSGPVDQRVS